MKKLIRLAVLSLAVLVVSVVIPVGKVAKSSGRPFSNSTLSGTYIFEGFAGGGASVAATLTGTAQFDGSGGVTGTISIFTLPQPNTIVPCSSVIQSGSTYSIDPTGALGMSLVFTPGEGCTGTTTRTFVGSVTHDGGTFVFAQNGSSNGNFGIAAGTGVSQ